MGVSEPAFSDNIRLSDDSSAVVIIDQSLLPGRVEYLTLKSAGEFWEAIRSLRVRGAPAIGIFAAYAVYVLSRQSGADDFDGFYRHFRQHSDYLASSRPTAVNLSKMLSRMDAAVMSNKGKSIPELLNVMKAEAQGIHAEDISMCRAISECGLSLIKDGDGVLTHCNAGPLATSRYGTALGPLILGHERGMRFHVYCDETRPLMQGARLTAYELRAAGIDCTLICDNMASIVMSEGKINACFVGCDRVAVNGDTANKIGTSGVAILARHYGIPFYVFCPSSTIDFSCANGGGIVIEQRPDYEITTLNFAAPMAPAGVKCYNPAFDVTPGSLITAIVTERGICRAPYEESLTHLFGEETI